MDLIWDSLRNATGAFLDPGGMELSVSAGDELDHLHSSWVTTWTPDGMLEKSRGLGERLGLLEPAPK